jgi:hypothetical protein
MKVECEAGHGGAQPCHGPPIKSCDGSNYTACRSELWRYVFNTTDGKLPSRSHPDFIEDLSNWTMEGLPGPGRGTGELPAPSAASAESVLDPCIA